MDYWSPLTIPTNMSNKLFRHRAPGSQTGAFLKKHDDAVGTSNFSVRYFHRDQIRKDTGYYPDTPLSLNHALMKPPHSQGLRPKAETPAKLVQPESVCRYKGFATPATMGVAKSEDPSNMGIP